MKRNYPLLFFILGGMALLSGMLTRGMSFVGRLGVHTFYKEYKFLKIWWQAALVCFGLYLFILLILYLTDKYLQGTMRKFVLQLAFFIFLLGLYFTFRDFRKDLSHRWLGERFHLGIYLYWIGFCIISLFFLTTKRHKNLAAFEKKDNADFIKK